MIKFIIKLIESKGYLVLKKTAKKSVFLNTKGEKYGVFKR